jgi:hypothetical protein
LLLLPLALSLLLSHVLLLLLSALLVSFVFPL